MTSPMNTKGFHGLIRQAQDGDRAAMDQVLEVLRPCLEPLAHSFADPARPAESTSDLLQECCLRAWRKLDSFQGGEDDAETFAMFRAWMSQILRRLGLNAHRDRMAKTQIPRDKIKSIRSGGSDSSGLGGAQSLAASPPTPGAAARGAEMADQVRAALDHLSDQTAADIVRLRLFHGLTIVQIAERLGLRPEKAQGRHRWAMRQLRRELGAWLKDWV